MRVAQIALVAAVAAGTVWLAAAPSGQQPAPSSSQPVFRTGIELLTIDVTALDEQGRQIADLSPAELLVEIDGQERRIVSADYVRLVDAHRPVMTAAERQRASDASGSTGADPFISTNTGAAAAGRLIFLVIDQGNIRVGEGRHAADQARRFIDRLQPEDRVGVALIPAPGDVVDFTTNHDRVKETLMRALGRAIQPRGRFNLSLTEARALHMYSDGRLAAEVLLRECGANLPAFDAERCQREVLQDAAELVTEVRQQTADSVRSLRNILTALAAIDGAKQVILISEALVIDDLGTSLDDLATAAADARASIDVLLLDVPAVDASQAARPTTPREDRSLQVEGLELLAAFARGSFFRVSTSAAFAFDRIVRALEGYYLIALEARAGDRDGERHRVAVKTTRKGVTLRTRRTVLSAMSGRGGSAVDAVTRALRSPLPARDLPMRLSTWRFKEPATTRHRVMVAVEVDRGAGQPLEYVTGFALIDRDNRAFAPEVASRTLAETREPGRALYSTMLVVDPGSYRLRIAMADTEGRIGSVEQELDVFHVDGTAVATGDLVLGRAPAKEGDMMAPAIEPRLAGEPVAAVTEVYLPQGGDRTAVAARIDVMRGEQAPVILSVPMPQGESRTPEIAHLQAVIDTSVLPPGRYLARATITFDGKPAGHAMRPFVIEARTGDMASAGVPQVLAASVVAALPRFEPKELFTPPVVSAVLNQAAARGPASADAIKEARSGDYAGAAMTALVSGDQAVAAFLKGLDLLQKGDPTRAAVQFQSAMAQAPSFVPARVYFGATLAIADKHREAAGLLQSGATSDAPAPLARLAGEEWLRAGQFTTAIPPLEAASKSDGDPRTQKALALAYIMANRPGDGLEVLTPYLAKTANDAEALLAGVYALYARHAAGAQPSLAADRALAQKWLKAYRAAGGTLPLAAAWITYLDALP